MFDVFCGCATVPSGKSPASVPVPVWMIIGSVIEFTNSNSKVIGAYFNGIYLNCENKPHNGLKPTVILLLNPLMFEASYLVLNEPEAVNPANCSIYFIS